MRKGRAALNEVITHEPEGPALREHDRLVVERAVAESKDEAAVDPLAANDLRQVAVGEELAVERAQREKAVDETFGAPDLDGLRRERGRRQGRAEEADGPPRACLRGVLPSRRAPSRSKRRTDAKGLESR